MPTAAKLAGAITMGFLALACSLAYGDVIPDGRKVGYLPIVAPMVGLILGWLSLGPAAAASQKLIEAMGSGLRVSVTVVLVVAVGFGTFDMLDRAMHGRYDTVLDAILAIFYRTIDLAQPALNADVLVVLLLGGLSAGGVTFAVSRRWS